MALSALRLLVAVDLDFLESVLAIPAALDQYQFDFAGDGRIEHSDGGAYARRVAFDRDRFELRRCGDGVEVEAVDADASLLAASTLPALASTSSKDSIFNWSRLPMPVARAASVTSVSAWRIDVELRKSVVVTQRWMPGSAACSVARCSAVRSLSGEAMAISAAPIPIIVAPATCGRASTSFGSISAISVSTASGAVNRASWTAIRDRSSGHPLCSGAADEGWSPQRGLQEREERRNGSSKAQQRGPWVPESWVGVPNPGSESGLAPTSCELPRRCAAG